MPSTPALVRQQRSGVTNASDAALIGASLAFLRKSPSSHSISLAASPHNNHSYTFDASHVNSGITTTHKSMVNGHAKVGGGTGAMAISQDEKRRSANHAQRSHLHPLPKDAGQLAISRPPSTGRNDSSTLAPSISSLSMRTQSRPESDFEAERGINLDHAAETPAAAPIRPATPTDFTPIAPTSALVGLFERKSSNASTPNTSSKAVAPAADPELQFPSLMHGSDSKIGPPRFQVHLEVASPDRNALNGGDKATFSRRGGLNPVLSSVAKIETLVNPPQNNSTKSNGKMPPQTQQKSSRSTGERTPSRSSQIKVHDDGHFRTGSPHSQIQNSMQPTIPRAGQSITAQYNQLHARRMTPLHTGDQLANAIVASSLASSRGPSPRRLEPSSAPIRRPKSSNFALSRTPSPAKHVMLHTLRSADSSDSDESEGERHSRKKHRKRRLVRKHPHKHHEGDRKRWRDAVTEREQKRYDGVWAANRGMHCALAPSKSSKALRQTPAIHSSLSDRVSNLVVKDIWSRSRLPNSVLEAVWNLVDGDCIGRLTKDEFVVGLWLIDQRLKGRKLPVKVSDSVWNSVRGLRGIKIRR